MPDDDQSQRPPIVHVFGRMRLADGGVVRAIADLCDAVAHAGRDVVLLSADCDEPGVLWPNKSDRLRVVRLPRPIRPVGAVPAEAVDALAGAGVIHLHSTWEIGHPVVARAARRLGIPYVLTAHGMLDEWCMRQRRAKKIAYLALAGRRLIERADAFHCTTRAEMDQALRWAPRARRVVIPPVFDAGEYTDLPGAGPARRRWPDAVTDARPAALFLGRVHPQKGPDLFIEAVAKLRASGIDADALIAGPGEDAYLDHLRGLAERLGVADRVHLLGLVRGREKVSLYEHASVFALPTATESFGYVYFEALAAGTPVVTTRGVDAWPELESSGGAALVERTAEAFSDAIRALLTDDDRRAAMGRAGRAWTLDRFAPGRVVGEYLDLYDRLMAGRQKD
ncbi:MAG: glycosyltransferase [Planctomycetota bacterium]|nr:MAG: glycosyltransferase [Planctomycetota bacterium]